MLRPGEKYGRVSQENSVFVYPPPVAHTFNSAWCYMIINEYYNEDTWFKRWAKLATKNSDLGILGYFWGDGDDSAQKVDTLAGR